MPWTDKTAVEQILKLRDRFNIKRFIETGTAEGNATALYSHYFEVVESCEIDKSLFDRAQQRLSNLKNVYLYHYPSPQFLKSFLDFYKLWDGNSEVIFYLDAHSPKDWPLLEELKELKGFKNCCIVIHDFKVEDLGYISYNGQDLDFNYVRDGLIGVNKDFHFYTNYKEGCDILKLEDFLSGRLPEVPHDEDAIRVLKYTWSSPRNTQRGILYAVPEELNNTFKLKRI